MVIIIFLFTDFEQVEHEPAVCLTARAANSIYAALAEAQSVVSRETVTPLCLALPWLHLEHCIQFWVPQHEKDVDNLQQVPQRAINMVRGLEAYSLREDDDTGLVLVLRNRFSRT